MHAIRFLGLVAALGLMSAAYAQARDERSPEPARKKGAPASLPDTVKPPKPSHHKSSTQSGNPKREREPAHSKRDSTPERPVPPVGQPQPARTLVKQPDRDTGLARCTDLRRRSEQAIRDEAQGGDATRMQRIAAERRSIYQEQLRAGCI